MSVIVSHVLLSIIWMPTVQQHQDEMLHSVNRTCVGLSPSPQDNIHTAVILFLLGGIASAVHCCENHGYLY